MAAEDLGRDQVFDRILQEKQRSLVSDRPAPPSRAMGIRSRRQEPQESERGGAQLSVVSVG